MTKARMHKCRICGKPIHRGGLCRRSKISGKNRYFHKTCTTKLLSSARRIYGKEKYPKEKWEL